MKKSTRWYLAWGIMSASLSMLLFTVTAGPAHAWTQDANPYSDRGSGSTDCGLTKTSPCLYWQEPHYTSINTYYYFDPSLQNVGGFNFVPEILQAFTQFNQVPAYNPYMYQWQPGDPTVGGSYTVESLICGAFGVTYLDNDPTHYTTPKQGYNPQRGKTEWYAFILYPPVSFSSYSQVIWDTNGDWSGSCPGPLHADARTVATHETGHVIGLGHSTFDPSVHPGDPLTIMNHHAAMVYQLYQLQTNDLQGIEAIYRGDQQSS
jgi:hypothetical protein